MEMACAKLLIRPETVEPSFAIVIKSSPGWRFGYNPTVIYPSWPPTSNLCVSEIRSSGNRFLTACGGEPDRGRLHSWNVLHGGSAFEQQLQEFSAAVVAGVV